MIILSRTITFDLFTLYCISLQWFIFDVICNFTWRQLLWKLQKKYEMISKEFLVRTLPNITCGSLYNSML